MKILCLGMNAVMEGELSYEARAVHHMADMGHEVDYWTDAPLSYMMEPVLQQPKSLRSFVFKEGRKALATTPRRLAPQDIGRIFREHQKEPYDVIYATATTGIDMGVWLKQCIDLPLVVQWLDVPYWRIDPFGPWELYQEAVIPIPLLPHQIFEGYRQEWGWWFSQLENCDAITTLHSVTKDQIIQYAGRDPKNIHVTYHGSVDHDTFDHALKGEVERKNQVICINRIDFHKGVDQTILVCSMIQDRMSDDPPLFVFVSRGSQQWYEDLLRERAQALLKRYRFTGWVDNSTKIRLLRESKVMLDNEWPEGFGGCNIGEAIYTGCRPIAWDRRSKKEVYPLGLDLVKKNDYGAMADKAVERLRNFSEPDEGAKRFVLEKRSIRSHAEGLLQVCEKVKR